MNYCISAKKLWETFRRLTDPQPSFVRLRFQDGTAVLFDESGNLSPAASDGGVRNPRGDGLTISDTAQAFGIDVDAHYDPESLYVDVNSIRWLNTALIMIGVAISIGLSVALSLNRIVRIEQLEKTVNDLSGLPANAAVPARPGDEYGRIRAILRPMRQEFNNLRINQQLYQSVLKQQTLHLLFHHFFKNRTEVNNALSVSGMELFEEQFYVFGIALRGAEDLPDALAARFADKLSCEETLPGKTLLYVLEELPNLDLSQSLRIAAAEDLIRQLQIAGAEVIGIAVSRVYQNVYLASFAYQEVRGLLEAMAQDAHFELKAAQDTSRGGSKAAKLDAQELNRFLNAVQNREIAAAKRALVRMNSHISVDAKDIREQQYLRFCLLQSLISCLQSSQTSGAFIDSLIRIDPSDETAFEEAINGLLERYIADTTPQDSFRSIVNYIREHYADCNLTAEQVAAFGGFNKTYLSRLFKSKI
ncbi:MAG TPA: hypothetical protein PKE04_19150, partial [Clostridia bacterium]|nr:hypothetical protein [Clostridia bacterium]